MRILLRLAEDLHHLVVYELYEQHNHILEAREDTKTPKSQMFRMSRVNTSRYTLTKMEEGANGQMVDIESELNSSEALLFLNFCMNQVMDLYILNYDLYVA